MSRQKQKQAAAEEAKQQAVEDDEPVQFHRIEKLEVFQSRDCFFFFGQLNAMWQFLILPSHFCPEYFLTTMWRFSHFIRAPPDLLRETGLPLMTSQN
jgi:hypothetical protein